MPPIQVVIRAPAAEPLTQMASASLQATAAHRGLDMRIEIIPFGSLGDFMGRVQDGNGFIFVSDPCVTAPMEKHVVVATRAQAVRHARALVDRISPRVSAPPSAILAPPVRRAPTARKVLPLALAGVVAVALGFVLATGDLLTTVTTWINAL